MQKIDEKDIVELSSSYDQALKDGVYKSIKEMSIAIGKSPSTICRIRTIAKLPEIVTAHVQTIKGIKDSLVLSKLAGLKNKESMERLYFDFIKRGYNRKEMLRTLDWSKKHLYKNQRKYANKKNLFVRRRGRISNFKVTNIDKQEYEKIKEFIKEVIACGK